MPPLRRGLSYEVSTMSYTRKSRRKDRKIKTQTTAERRRGGNSPAARRAAAKANVRVRPTASRYTKVDSTPKNRPTSPTTKPKVTKTSPSELRGDKKVTKPRNGKPAKTSVPKRPRVTGKGSRNVSTTNPNTGKRTLANVTREQLIKAGLTTGPKGLRKYLNFMDRKGRRPTAKDFK
jgi:hypothetical protein